MPGKSREISKVLAPPVGRLGYVVLFSHMLRGFWWCADRRAKPVFFACAPAHFVFVDVASPTRLRAAVSRHRRVAAKSIRFVRRSHRLVARRTGRPGGEETCH